MTRQFANISMAAIAVIAAFFIAVVYEMANPIIMLLGFLVVITVMRWGWRYSVDYLIDDSEITFETLKVIKEHGETLGTFNSTQIFESIDVEVVNNPPDERADKQTYTLHYVGCGEDVTQTAIESGKYSIVFFTDECICYGKAHQTDEKLNEASTSA